MRCLLRLAKLEIHVKPAASLLKHANFKRAASQARSCLAQRMAALRSTVRERLSIASALFSRPQQFEQPGVGDENRHRRIDASLLLANQVSTSGQEPG